MNPALILLGILSSTTLVISALSVHRLRLLLFGIATGVLVSFEYAITGAWTGLFSVAIGLTWTALMALSYRYKMLTSPKLVPVVLAAQIASFIAFTPWGDRMTPVMFVPLLGGLIGVFAVYTKELLYTKGMLMLAGGAWLGYEYTNHVYGQMIGESLNLIANTVALSALTMAKVRGIPRSAMQNLDTQFLETITGAITLPRSYRGVENRLPESSLKGRKKPIRGAHPNSVGYARMTAEYDRGFRQMQDELVNRFIEVDERETQQSSR